MRDLYLFLIEDGAETWVIAPHAGRAVFLHAQALGYETRNDYLEATGDVHTVRKLAGYERVKMKLDARPQDLAAAAYEKECIPNNACFLFAVEATAEEWVKANPSEQVLMSSEV